MKNIYQSSVASYLPTFGGNKIEVNSAVVILLLWDWPRTPLRVLHLLTFADILGLITCEEAVSWSRLGNKKYSGISTALGQVG